MPQGAFVCGYCGTLAAATDDHVPPKSFFEGITNEQLRTVKSCALCNQGASDDDEYFRDTVVKYYRVADQQKAKPIVEKMLRAAALPAKRRYAEAHLRSFTGVFGLSPSAPGLGPVPAFYVDGARMQRAARRYVRGLYRYDFGVAPALRALRGATALRAPASAGTRTPATERAQPLPAPRNAHFLDAALACSEARVALCYDDPSQTGYEVVTAVVDGEVQRDSVLVTVQQPATIEILRAGGPNLGGSFTSAPGENILQFEAAARGLPVPPQIRWDVADDATHGYTLRLPPSVTGGLVASTTVPRQDSLRYAGLLLHPAPLDSTALRFIVSATTVGLQPTVMSAPRIVQQTELDALREEYIEYRIPLPEAAWTVQGYATSTAFSFGVLNQGDYSWAVIDPVLPLKLDTLQRLAGVSLTITSGFRDPMHYRVHAHVTVHPLSIHQYGGAADIATWNSDASWYRLRDKARLTGACIEPRDVSSNNHLHVDYDRPSTTPCSPRWR